MDLREKTLIINLFFEGKIYDLIINPKKSFKFLLMKIAGELEFEEFEKLREKYVLSFKSTNLNDTADQDILESLFKGEIKNAKDNNEVIIRLKLEDKQYLKPEIKPMKQDEFEVFKVELKQKKEILETEGHRLSHDLIQKSFKSKVEDKYSVFLNEMNLRKTEAIESKNYSFMLLNRIRNYLEDENLRDEFEKNAELLQQCKNEIKKFTYLDSERFKLFLDKAEEKINDLIAFVTNLSEDYNYSRTLQFTEKAPEFPTELKIFENEDLLEHINQHSKNGICIKKYLEAIPKKINLAEFREDFSYYYKYSLAKIAKVHLENFDFGKKNEKLILEDILLQILEHNNFKIPELHVNFYYGNIAEFISKIISIDRISLTEKSLKLNGLEHLQPFNKIKKIYVDPSITKEKNLISRLMSENCNFDKKLNIFSNSEYVDYSMFTNLEKIHIKFSSKVAQMFNVSLSGNKLVELLIEDVNEDYKMNFHEKNKFDFNFYLKKKEFRGAKSISYGEHNCIKSLHKRNNSGLNCLNINNPEDNKKNNINVDNKKINEGNENLENDNNIGSNRNKSLSAGAGALVTDNKPILAGLNLKKFNGFRDSSSCKKTCKNNFFRFNVNKASSSNNELAKSENYNSKSKSPKKDFTRCLNFSPKSKDINKNSSSSHKGKNFFDVLLQNINIHEKYNSFANLKFVKFTNCLLNSKFKISHCSNLKELYFDDCLFIKAPFDYFASAEKLTFKTCFQKISLEEINTIAEKYKHLYSFSLIDPTDEFLEILIRSNLFFNLKSVLLMRIFQENYDEIFKLILKTNAFEKLVFFPDYKRCTDMLLIIKFLDFMLKYNNKLESLDFLVGLKFHNANIDRVKFFLRKLKYLKTVRLFMPKSEEAQWRELFKDFKNVEWSIETETTENDLMSYYLS